MRDRPRAVAFDVMGTLFPLGPLRELIVGLGLPPQALELWFARTLRDGFALSAAGDFQPFPLLAWANLDGLLAQHDRPTEPHRIDEVFNRLSKLPARPDTAAAMTLLIKAGIRVLTVTNGTRKNTQSLLNGAGLDRFIKQIVTIDDVKAWKPRSEVYLHAASQLGIPPGSLALVAAHAWDCYGAARAGLVTGWVSRPEMRFNPAFGEPDVQGETLTAVADALLGLPVKA